MPITFEHSIGPIGGLAGYAAGYGRARDRRRKEALDLLQEQQKLQYMSRLENQRRLDRIAEQQAITARAELFEKGRVARSEAAAKARVDAAALKAKADDAALESKRLYETDTKILADVTAGKIRYKPGVKEEIDKALADYATKWGRLDTPEAREEWKKYDAYIRGLRRTGTEEYPGGYSSRVTAERAGVADLRSRTVLQDKEVAALRATVPKLNNLARSKWQEYEKAFSSASRLRPTDPSDPEYTRKMSAYTGMMDQILARARAEQFGTQEKYKTTPEEKFKGSTYIYNDPTNPNNPYNGMMFSMGVRNGEVTTRPIPPEKNRPMSWQERIQDPTKAERALAAAERRLKDEGKTPTPQEIAAEIKRVGEQQDQVMQALQGGGGAAPSPQPPQARGPMPTSVEGFRRKFGRDPTPQEVAQMQYGGQTTPAPSPSLSPTPTPTPTAAPAPPAAMPVVRNDADYDRLPSGTIFMAPDGSRRRKP